MAGGFRPFRSCVCVLRIVSPLTSTTQVERSLKKTMSASPTENDLRSALHVLRKAFPSLGAAKLHAQLLTQHPDWTVSEKRTRKILQQEGLVLSSVSAQTHGPAQPGLNSADDNIPRSQLVEGLDIRKWTTKVEVRLFGRKKGKGLVASENIAEGEVVWKEEPFSLAPEW